MPSKDERYVKSYPSLQNSPIWPEDALFKLYHYCLYKASWNTFDWHGFQINPGEFPMSLRHAEEELCWSRNKLLRRLAVLERLGYIRTKKTAEGTLVWVNRCPDANSIINSQHTENQADGRMEGTPEWFQKRTAGGSAMEPQRSNIGTTGGSMMEPQRSNIGTAGGSKMEPQRSNIGTAGGSTMEPQRSNIGTAGGSAMEPQRSNIGTAGGSMMEPYQKEYKKNTYSTVASDPDGFSAVWCAYPEDRRTDRNEAVRQYRLAISLGATPQAIMDALNAAKCSEAWRQDGGRFIPGICKWLQKETWRDYVTTAEDEEEELWVSR